MTANITKIEVTPFNISLAEEAPPPMKLILPKKQNKTKQSNEASRETC